MSGWTAEEIVRELLAAGFAKVRQNATSHAIWRHSDGRQVVVPMHKGDVPPGTLSNMRRTSKLSLRK